MNDNSNEALVIKEGLEKTSIIAVTDSQGVITYVNDEFCKISGYTVEELLGKTHRLINSGHHDKSFFKSMWESIGKGEIWRGEIKNRDKSGHQYWVDTTIIPFLNESGEPYKYISVRNVITSKKLMNEVMEAMISVNNLEGVQLYERILKDLCNILEMHSSIFSLKTKNDSFKTVAAVIDGEVVKPFEYSLENNPCVQTVKKGGVYIENEVLDKYPNCDFAKTNKLKSYVGIPLLGSKGEVFGLLCFFDTKEVKNSDLFARIINLIANRLKDEMNRLEALKAMQESEACMRGVFSSAVDGIIMLSEDGKIQNMNPSAVNIFSLNKSSVRGLDVSEILPDLLRKVDGTLVFKIPARGGETPGLKANGHQFPVYVTYSTVKQEGDEFYSLFVRNLTEQKEAEEKLQSAEKELNAQTLFNQRLSALAAMAGGIAHELNQPLSGIRIYAEMINNMVDGTREIDNEKVATTIEKVIKQVHRASKIIDHMRAFSSDKTDENHDSEIISLNECIESSLELIGQQLKNNGITFINEVEKDHKINVNLHRLEQVFINLFSNAKDSINEKNYRIGEDKIIHVSSFKSADRIELIVRDTGAGIPDSVKTSLFEPFVSSKIPGKGSGLGLPICIGILRDFDATIELLNTSSEGTTFKLEFPGS